VPPLLHDLVGESFSARERLGLDEEVGERATDDLAARISVERFSAGAPRCDRALAVDAQDRLGGGFLDALEPALCESMRSSLVQQSQRQPPGGCSRDKPERNCDQRSKPVFCDEKEGQQPADGRCGERDDEKASWRLNAVQVILLRRTCGGSQSEARPAAGLLGRY
jgi:hypothetical protein